MKQEAPGDYKQAFQHVTHLHKLYNYFYNKLWQKSLKLVKLWYWPQFWRVMQNMIEIFSSKWVGDNSDDIALMTYTARYICLQCWVGDNSDDIALMTFTAGTYVCNKIWWSVHSRSQFWMVVAFIDKCIIHQECYYSNLETHIWRVQQIFTNGM